MSDARHTPPGDRSFAASLMRHLAIGAGLIAVVALVFWGIGRFRGPTSEGPVISAPTDTTATPTAGSGEPDQDDATGPSPDRTTAEPTSEPATEPAPPTETTTPTETATPEPDGTEAATDETRSSVSVQVLDATGGDGDRLQAVVDRLRELGYRVVATNRAVRTYERSTVFYTDGHRDDAVMIREDIPELSVVEEKPDNLSDSVDAHVIVGEDYPES